jgi:hypothetical protein
MKQRDKENTVDEMVVYFNRHPNIRTATRTLSVQNVEDLEELGFRVRPVRGESGVYRRCLIERRD